MATSDDDDRIWQEGAYAERTLGPDDEYTTPLLPGLAVSLAVVFA